MRIEAQPGGIHTSKQRRFQRPAPVYRTLLSGAVAVWALASGLAAPLAAGTNWWTSLGPNGGLVSVVVPDPTDPQVVYAGTYDSGVYKSADAGASWQLASSGLLDVYISDLTADPRHPGSVYAATFSGLYVSRDFAATWSAVPFPGGDRPLNLAIDPRHPDTLYMMTSFDLMITRDGGKHWSANSIARRQSAYLVADPFRSSVFLLEVDYGGDDDPGRGVVWLETTDGGTTWTDRTALLPEPVRGAFYPPLLAVEPSPPGRLWLAFAYGFGTHVFSSADGGATWQAKPGDVPFAVGTGGLVVAGDVRSLDGGETWESAGSYPEHPGSLAIGPDPSRVYAAGQTGVLVSGDGAQSWQVAKRGLTATKIQAAAVDPQNPARLYTAVAGTGLWRSPNGGRRWRSLAPDLKGDYDVEIVIDPSSPSTVYFSSNSTFLSRTTDAGFSWEPMPKPANDCFWVRRLAVDPSSSSTLYAIGVMGGGSGCNHPACTAFKSSDGGASWTCMPPDGLERIVVAPSAPSTLYGVGDFYSPSPSLLTSGDGGATWSPIDAGLPAKVRELAVDPGNDQRLFVSTTDGGVWRSRDGGLHWREWDRGLPRSVWAPLLAIDPQDTQLLYAARADIGVYRSRNGGRSWEPILGGLPPVDDPKRHTFAEPYTALIPDPKSSGTVYLATTGRGLLVYSAE